LFSISMKVIRRRGLMLAAMAAIAVAPGAAAAKTYAPKNGLAYHGVSDTGEIADFFGFADQVNAHPALLQEFFHWRVPLTTGAFERWAKANTRGVLSLSTTTGEGVEVITPRQIATGKDDRYVLRLARTIAEAKQTVYVRLMAEMNGYWNAYCAYNADGSPRRGGHSTHWFKQAWRRFALIIRGGSRDEVNEKLVRLGMPRILRAKSQNDPVYEGGADGIPLPVGEHLPQPRVAMMWVPQSFGSPSVSKNQPGNYWPGGRYVDWVGFDIYSKFAGAFDDDRAFFERYRHKPFVIGEYGPWDNDYSGAFTRALFDWIESHDRVKMALYYRDVTTTNPYNVQYYPGAQAVLQSRLNDARWVKFAPGVKQIPDPPPGSSTGRTALAPNPASPIPPFGLLGG
jgi:hypothetical protein